MMSALLVFTLAFAGEHSFIKGVTISTPTDGKEWATPQFDRALDQIASLGGNWVTIHPYAFLRPDGSLVFSEISGSKELSHPIHAAHQRNMKILIKPHIGYWGSGFQWRGEIVFEGVERDRFFAQYQAWITLLAKEVNGADAFVVGTELDKMTSDERWLPIIHSVRSVFPGHLTYAANWDSVEKVPFWSELDAIGVQAYYPLSASERPTDEELEEGWRRWAAPLIGLSHKTGKPIVFTELGYDRSAWAAREPWRSGGARDDGALQRRCFSAAFKVMSSYPEYRGAMLWKWFPNNRRIGDFRLTDRLMQHHLERLWED